MTDFLLFLILLAIPGGAALVLFLVLVASALIVVAGVVLVYLFSVVILYYWNPLSLSVGLDFLFSLFAPGVVLYVIFRLRQLAKRRELSRPPPPPPRRLLAISESAWPSLSDNKPLPKPTNYDSARQREPDD
jgi:ABC-type transport system involved in multi-copper enzyme maturation permease subunit